MSNGMNRGSVILTRAAVIVLWLAAMIFGSSAALAHRSAAAARNDGVSIPTLTHGQMVVVAAHFNEIRALSDKVVFDDITFRKINNYVSLQYAACLWGLMPGSVSDEASPFNECSHGYLSAAQLLLQHMKALKGVGPAAEALYEKISIEMVLNNASALLCRYSDEPFNSADVEAPHWSDIASHPPSLIALSTTFGLCTLGPILAVYLWNRRRGFEPR